MIILANRIAQCTRSYRTMFSAYMIARRDILKMADDRLDELKLKWGREQDELKQRCNLTDVAVWQMNRSVMSSAAVTDQCSDDEERSDHQTRDDVLRYVAGTDISFIKDDDVNACASLVIIELPTCKVVYEDTCMVSMEVPYIPGFLAFREAPFFIEKLNRLRSENPELMPQAVLVDGNGILHTKGFGLACHIGLGVGIPSVGVAKTLFHVDGLEKNEEHQNKIKEKLKKAGDTFPLIGASGTTYGVALRCHDSTTNPVYVSQGYNISLDAAVWLVQQCSKYRIPEPIRQADIRSREFLRKLQNNKPTITPPLTPPLPAPAVKT